MGHGLCEEDFQAILGDHESWWDVPLNVQQKLLSGTSLSPTPVGLSPEIFRRRAHHQTGERMKVVTSKTRRSESEPLLGLAR